MSSTNSREQHGINNSGMSSFQDHLASFEGRIRELSSSIDATLRKAYIDAYGSSPPVSHRTCSRYSTPPSTIKRIQQLEAGMTLDVHPHAVLHATSNNVQLNAAISPITGAISPTSSPSTSPPSRTFDAPEGSPQRERGALVGKMGAWQLPAAMERVGIGRVSRNTSPSPPSLGSSGDGRPPLHRSETLALSFSRQKDMGSASPTSDVHRILQPELHVRPQKEATRRVEHDEPNVFELPPGMSQEAPRVKFEEELRVPHPRSHAVRPTVPILSPVDPPAPHTNSLPAAQWSRLLPAHTAEQIIRSSRESSLATAIDRAIPAPVPSPMSLASSRYTQQPASPPPRGPPPSVALGTTAPNSISPPRLHTHVGTEAPRQSAQMQQEERKREDNLLPKSLAKEHTPSPPPRPVNSSPSRIASSTATFTVSTHTNKPPVVPRAAAPPTLAEVGPKAKAPAPIPKKAPKKATTSKGTKSRPAWNANFTTPVNESEAIESPVRAVRSPPRILGAFNGDGIEDDARSVLSPVGGSAENAAKSDISPGPWSFVRSEALSAREALRVNATPNREANACASDGLVSVSPTASSSPSPRPPPQTTDRAFALDPPVTDYFVVVQGSRPVDTASQKRMSFNEGDGLSEPTTPNCDSPMPSAVVLSESAPATGRDSADMERPSSERVHHDHATTAFFDAYENLEVALPAPPVSLLRRQKLPASAPASFRNKRQSSPQQKQRVPQTSSASNSMASADQSSVLSRTHTSAPRNQLGSSGRNRGVALTRAATSPPGGMHLGTYSDPRGADSMSPSVPRTNLGSSSGSTHPQHHPYVAELQNGISVEKHNYKSRGSRRRKVTLSRDLACLMWDSSRGITVIQLSNIRSLCYPFGTLFRAATYSALSLHEIPRGLVGRAEVQPLLRLLGHSAHDTQQLSSSLDTYTRVSFSYRDALNQVAPYRIALLSHDTSSARTVVFDLGDRHRFVRFVVAVCRVLSTVHGLPGFYGVTEGRVLWMLACLHLQLQGIVGRGAGRRRNVTE